MPNTRMDKAKFKNHLHYAKWFYILGIIVTIFVCDIAFTTTRYQSPDERAVVVQLVDSYADTEVLTELAGKLLSDGREYDETLETVEFYALSYSGDSQGDYYGAQKFMVETMAGENDIYLVSRDLTKTLQFDGLCYPLDTLELYPELLLQIPEEELYWDNELGEEIGVDENGYAMYEVLDERHAYAIPCTGLNGFVNLGSYDITDKYIVLASTSKNVDTTFRTILNMMEYMRQPLAGGTEGEAE